MASKQMPSLPSRRTRSIDALAEAARQPAHRVWHDRETALAVDRLERRRERLQALDRLLDEQRKQMALDRRHLFADDATRSDSCRAPRPRARRVRRRRSSCSVIAMTSRSVSPRRSRASSGISAMPSPRAV